MLELILTRTDERQLIAQAQDLRFLVLDELHTYRGRQGADVAMLCRRVRDACSAERLQCVGTSATLAGEGTLQEQREDVARVASRLFGTAVRPDRVIGETLERATLPPDGTRDFAAGLAEHRRQPGCLRPRRLRPVRRRSADSLGGIHDRCCRAGRSARARRATHPRRG